LAAATAPRAKGSKVKLAPVRSEADYEKSLARLETLFGAAPGTPEADELEVISLLVERYEQSKYRDSCSLGSTSYSVSYGARGSDPTRPGAVHRVEISCLRGAFRRTTPIDRYDPRASPASRNTS
jgi:hypothetical protein